MNCDRVALGDSVVKFTRVGREWISEPISDDVADAAESHPHFGVYETDEEITPTEINPSIVNLSDTVEVERMLRAMPAEELPTFVRFIENTPNLVAVLINTLDEDTLREFVRREVFAEDLIGYVKDPVPVLCSIVVSNADFISELRDKAMAFKPDQDAVLAGGVTTAGDLDQGTLTDEEKSLFDKLNLGGPEGDATESGDAPEATEPARGKDGTDVPDGESKTTNETEDPLEAAIETAKRNKKAK
jgi:hypothetical protein